MAQSAQRLVITGRVQGVGYRLWARREARRRNLRGWVRNRFDGSVEALVIGAPGAIDDFAAACRRGPAMAEVDDVVGSPVEDDGSADFHERPTA